MRVRTGRRRGWIRVCKRAAAPVTLFPWRCSSRMSRRRRSSHGGASGWSSSWLSSGREPAKSPTAAASARQHDTANEASYSPRAGRPARRPGDRLSRARSSRRLGPLRRRSALGRDRDRRGRRRGSRVRDRRQRRDGQGRLVLPADREEAPPRPGGRAAEPASLPLPRRLGRRLPATAGRRLPRSRALRPDLLQPSADVGTRDPADRGRDGVLHRRRRLRARDERRDGDRARDRDDLHRRATAREGRDRPGRDGGGARRSRRAHAPVGRRRPLRHLRRARGRDRAPDRGESAPGHPPRRRGPFRTASRRLPTRPSSTG